ncbi:symplekin-like isoform X1 [Haliotis cracherodii]|uniref:symplekin-like isoform X1 n=3 Tax=Haliotis cracherodii TaxID=6455 RepID=UPI0039E7A7CB
MSGEGRRSTAAQFFIEEDAEAEQSTSTYERVVELLNQASLAQRDAQKISNLRQVQELIVHKDPTLLDNFLDEILAFQSDRAVDVKRFVIGFMEEASKKDPEVLSKVLPSLNMLLADENVNVQKKVILTSIQMFKYTIQWLSKAKTPTPEKTASWEQMHTLKTRLFEMLDSENDGIRTHVVKFLETVVLVLSKRSADSDAQKQKEGDVSLDMVPDGRHYLKLKKLEDQGLKTFEMMLHFLGSPHISSINLMTVMGALTNVARQRPLFFDQVVQAFEALHVNLPPTLAKSQVASVRKNLKMHMMSLLKHPASVDYVTQITTLLTDLGASQSEVSKFLPKVDESRKRKNEEPSTSSKKAKVEEDAADEEDDDIGMTPWSSRNESNRPTGASRQTAIDITADDLCPRLSPQNVADLVLLSMVMLPDTAPAQFQATYTPIAAAGTETQIRHIARLLATQLTMAGMGKGLGELQRSAMEAEITGDGDTSPASPMSFEPTSPKQLIQTLVGGTVSITEFKKPEPIAAPVVQPRKGVIRQFKLSSVTHPLDSEKLDYMTLATVKRVFNTEKIAVQAHVPAARTKILACLTAAFGGELKDVMQTFIFEDLRNRADLAFAWLFQEYANCQGFSVSAPLGERPTLHSYDECLTRLLTGLLEAQDQKDGLFGRLMMEAPLITDNATHILKRYCQDPARLDIGMAVLKDLILMRPSQRLRFLDVLLDLTSHYEADVRNMAIETTKELYNKPSMQSPVEKYALVHLKKLLLPRPPPSDSNQTIRVLRSTLSVDIIEHWTEDVIKSHLYLYLGLLPSNHRLIHELANVYTATSADIKRTILRVLEIPVKGMGMQSPELLTMVENCPKGAETLVMRVIHILTDKTLPSSELVERIRDLYQKRVPDVRFLIPVLTGLTKVEVISALPKLIKLNPMVVKEVFHRLMGGYGDSTASYTSPLTPAELLVALHNIDPAKCDMKTIIKAANLCFSEKMIYTQEVLAIVMQQLMEQTPLPTLLMRTVLQSLSMYPRLIGFVMNILQRLIIKQVWKQKKVWEGFVKCCQRTKPQSYQVLLQLPASQLKNAFEICPDIREPLLCHVKAFTSQQQAHIPKGIMTVLETDPLEEQRKAEAARVEAEKKAKQKEEEETFVKLEAERIARERAEKEKSEKEKADREMREKEKLEKEKLEKEKQKAERDKLEREKKEKEKLEVEKKQQLERERKEKEEQEKAIKKEKQDEEEKQRREKEKEEVRKKKEREEKLAVEKAEKDRLEQERTEKERLKKEKERQDKMEKERRDKMEKEREEKERREKEEKERQEKEKEEEKCVEEVTVKEELKEELTEEGMKVLDEVGEDDEPQVEPKSEVSEEGGASTETEAMETAESSLGEGSLDLGEQGGGSQEEAMDTQEEEEQAPAEKKVGRSRRGRGGKAAPKTSPVTRRSSRTKKS